MDEKTNQEINLKGSLPDEPPRRRMRWPKWHWTAVTSLVLLVAVFALGLWAVTENRAHVRYQARMEDIYSKSFMDLIDAMGNLEVKLAKATVAITPQSATTTLADIYRQANISEENLGQLPANLGPMEEVSSFVNQLGDYCQMLSRKAADGQALTQEERDQLRTLWEQCNGMNGQLLALQKSLQQEQVRWSEVAFAPTLDGQEEYGAVVDGFSQLQNEATEYPALIYDGPFSDSRQNREPKGLGETGVSQEEAADIAAEFVTYLGAGELILTVDSDGRIPYYGFDFQLEDERSGHIAITKMGGKPLLMNTTPTPQEDPTVDTERCKAAAVQFLEEKGFGDMQATYIQVYNGMVVVNCAAQQDGVTLYPDLVKVQVCCNDGRVLGLEAQNYWTEHVDRELPAPEIAQEEAQDKVAPFLTVETTRLALIPLDDGSEQLCWEIGGRASGNEFIVYINAQTGEDENSFLILDSEDGQMVL